MYYLFEPSYSFARIGRRLFQSRARFDQFVAAHGMTVCKWGRCGPYNEDQDSAVVLIGVQEAGTVIYISMTE